MSSRKVSANPEANLHVKQLHMLKLLNIHLNHFPKHEKYGLSQQIRNAAYDIYNITTECQKRYHKKTSLVNLDIRHEQLRMLIKLAFELGYYEYKDSRNNLGEKEARRRYQEALMLLETVNGYLSSELELTLSKCSAIGYFQSKHNKGINHAL